MNQTPMQNNRKINKVLYIVTVTLLFAIAVVIAITTAANRREKNPAVPDGSDSIIGTGTESLLSPDTTAPVTTDRDRDAIQKPEVTDPPKQTDTEASIDSEKADDVAAEPPAFDLPTVGILSKGHDTELQVYSTTMNDYRIHTGIDIVTEEGAPVYAAADGVISQVWDDPLMGKCIAISHSGECYTVYKNLSEDIAQGIEAGVNVHTGQLIASVGGTAMVEIAEEPHLHFEITVAGEAVDPLEHLSENALVSLTIDASYES